MGIRISVNLEKRKTGAPGESQRKVGTETVVCVMGAWGSGPR